MKEKFIMVLLRKSLIILVCCLVFFMLFPVGVFGHEKSPPLPLHGIEGMGGVCSTYSAYLVNPAKDGKVFGLPSLEVAYIHLGKGRGLEALTITETLWDRLEAGYAFHSFDFGDLSQDIENMTGVDINDHSVNMHNFNLRFQAVRENFFDLAWIPAVTVGIHYKKNNDIGCINNKLSGALKGIGIEDDKGLDFTVYFTKMITSLPRPLLVNAGIRSTKAAHLGLFGFTDDRKTLFEGNLVLFITNKILCGIEYRQKPDEYDEIPGLIKKEDDWSTLCLCFVINDQMTFSGGYGHFGDVLNHKANNSWCIKFKWEF